MQSICAGLSFGTVPRSLTPPQYETDHKDSLAQDWPHIPISKDWNEFSEIAKLGEQVSCLLNPFDDASSIVKSALGPDRKSLPVVCRVGGSDVSENDLRIEYSYYGAAKGRWDQRSIKEEEAHHQAWGDVTGDLYLNKSIFLRNVPLESWRYELGGYPILKKWLGYRQTNRRNGAGLTLQELDELRDLIHRVLALLTLRPLLNSAYEKASGNAWLLDAL